MANKTYKLGETAAKQLAETVRRVRAMPAAGPPRQRRRSMTVPPRLYIGVLTADLLYATATGASCNRYTGPPGSETPTASPDTVYEWMLRPGEKIASGSQVVYARINNVFYVIAAQCPATGS